MNINNELHTFFSTASLMLKIYLKQLDPNINFGEMNISDEGFWIDFYSNKIDISSKDFNSINKKINKLIFNIGSYDLLNLSKEKAIAFLKNDYYSSELILKSHLNTFRFIEFNNLNLKIWHEGYILEKINELKAFSLLSISGAYWQGNENNVQMKRIYGCGFADENTLKNFIKELENRKERDHRKIGKNLELFTFNKLVGQGLPIWLPKGVILKKIIGDYVHNCQIKHGFNFVSTPILGSIDLYKISGHYNHYNQDMFPPIVLENEEIILRPMTCPHHCLIYMNKKHSYRELPIRLSEDSILHRYESSGSLTGLERVRSMTLLDSHIFCRSDQIENEITIAYNIINEVINSMNLKFERVDLALHDPKNKDKFIDDPQMWEKSEKQLKDALKKLNINYIEQIGDAAFYGPKIDFQCRTILNKIITCSTIQLDFSLPNKFNITYLDHNQHEQKCVIIHLGIIGTYERFVATLLEQTNGVLPFWLSPIQIQIIPVNPTIHEQTCEILSNKLKDNNLRCEIDARDERLSKRIRDAQTKKIPIQIVIGDKEKENLNLINYRIYGSDKVESIVLEDFINLLKLIEKEKKDIFNHL